MTRKRGTEAPARITPGQRVRLLLAACLAFGAAGPAAAQPTFSDIYFFGDSLTDTGNLLFLVPDELFDPPYWQGRISNGPVWADYLAEDLGLTAKPWLQGGTNFAVGGTRSSDLDVQVNALALELFFEGDDADPEALYAIWGGSELRQLPSDPGAVASSVRRVLGAIEDLEDLGAELFLVLSLPDLGVIFGLSPEEKLTATGLSRDFNAQLASALAPRLGRDVWLTDVFRLTEEIQANPAAFDFVEIATPCLEDPVCEASPQSPLADGFLLLDHEHPTTATHRLVADRALAVLLPEPGALPRAATAGGSLILVWGLRRRRCAHDRHPG